VVPIPQKCGKGVHKTNATQHGGDGDTSTRPLTETHTRHETMYVHVCDLRLRPRRGLESTRRGSGRHAPYAETRMQDEESRRLTQTRVRTGEAGFDTSTPSPRRSGGRGGLPAGSESSAGRGVITNPSQAEYLEARTSERRPTRATNNTHCENNRGLSMLQRVYCVNTVALTHLPLYHASPSHDGAARTLSLCLSLCSARRTRWIPRLAVFLQLPGPLSVNSFYSQ